VRLFKTERTCFLSSSIRWIPCDQGRPTVKPPSTTKACPVTQLDSLLASQSAALAISAGSPALPSGLTSPIQVFTRSGICSTRSADSSGKMGAQMKVAVPPGQMALTLIPRSASSKATDFVSRRLQTLLPYTRASHNHPPHQLRLQC
jgi:hypothetical protein